MYCSYNVKLFKPFVSMKTKIVPAMADDWEIIPDTYRGNDGFKLYSKKLNQTVADIDLRRFLNFSKKYNLIIDSLKLKGDFIIGNDRSVYTKDMYNKWKEKYEERTETNINKKDLIVGSKYETPCGSQFIYLGKYYNINFKKGYENGLYILTNIKSVYLISNELGNSVSVLNQKVKEKISDNEFSNEKIDDIIEKYRLKSNIGYVGKEKIVPTKIKLKESQIDKSLEWGGNGYFEFAEVDYEGESIVVANIMSIYGGTYKDTNEDYKIKLKDWKFRGERTKKPEKLLSGRQVILNNLSIFDEKTLTFDSEKFKRNIYSSKPIYAPLKRVFTMEVTGE